jgi:predicted outer membrane protein
VHSACLYRPSAPESGAGARRKRLAALLLGPLQLSNECVFHEARHSETWLAEGAKPNDAQIAHIAYTAGQLDIAAAEQAKQKSKNKDVLAFADDMERDHKAAVEPALGGLEVRAAQKSHPCLVPPDC